MRREPGGRALDTSGMAETPPDSDNGNLAGANVLHLRSGHPSSEETDSGLEANEQAKSSRAVRGGSDPMSEPHTEKQGEAWLGSAKLREQDKRAPQYTAGPRNLVLDRTHRHAAPSPRAARAVNRFSRLPRNW